MKSESMCLCGTGKIKGKVYKEINFSKCSKRIKGNIHCMVMLNSEENYKYRLPQYLYYNDYKFNYKVNLKD